MKDAKGHGSEKHTGYVLGARGMRPARPGELNDKQAANMLARGYPKSKSAPVPTHVNFRDTIHELGKYEFRDGQFVKVSSWKEGKGPA